MMQPDPAQPLPSAFRRPKPWLAAGLAVSLLWAGTATYLVLFHDQAVTRLLAGQMAMRTAYEARVAGLRERLAGATAERTEAESALAARVEGALARQAELERRQAALAGLVDVPTTGAISPPATLRDPLAGYGAAPEAPAAPAGPGRRSALETEDDLIRLEARLDGVQEAQGAYLGKIAAGVRTEIARLRAVVLRAGLDPSHLLPPAPGAGLGGPYVALDSGTLARQGFDGGLAVVGRLLGDGKRLWRIVGELPLRRPLAGDAPVSSGFGPRIDPFTRGFALHTGLDLKAETGEPARATAPGVVTTAEWAGGYGNMVEVDHGHGLVTRFGHLARIAVRAGQRVGAGEVIGFVGSTGRSTGAHLHYETRIDGEPVDPQRFLDAGRALAGIRLAGG